MTGPRDSKKKEIKKYVNTDLNSSEHTLESPGRFKIFSNMTIFIFKCNSNCNLKCC